MNDDTPAPPTDLPGRLTLWAEYAAMAALAAMTFLVVVQVFARDVLHLGLPGADELARYSGLAIIYLTAPLLLLQNKHVLVDLLINVFPSRLRAAIDLLNEIFIVAFCALFLWGGWLFLQRAGRFSTPALGMPNLVFYTPVMLGMLLLSFVAVIRLVRTIARLRRGDFRAQANEGIQI
jgi:TRAP-type transport system small permease protein